MSCDQLREQYETLQDAHTQLQGAHAQLQKRYNTMRTVATIHNHHREALEKTVNAQVCLTQPAFCDKLVSDQMLRQPADDHERVIDAAVNSLRAERLADQKFRNKPMEAVHREYGERLTQVRQDLSERLGAGRVDSRMNEYAVKANQQATFFGQQAAEEMDKARLHMGTRVPRQSETNARSDHAYHTAVEMHADSIHRYGVLGL